MKAFQYLPRVEGAAFWLCVAYAAVAMLCWWS